VLGRDCTASELPAHDGFQSRGRVREHAMGEVAAEDKLPSLLITEAPGSSGRPGFQLKVSTRNLVRDRFLGAGRRWLLPGELVPQRRGPAARALPHRLPDPASTDEAPDSSGLRRSSWPPRTTAAAARPDTVTINVPGIDSRRRAAVHLVGR
jgi:hypothetical protein